MAKPLRYIPLVAGLIVFAIGGTGASTASAALVIDATTLVEDGWTDGVNYWTFPGIANTPINDIKVLIGYAGAVTEFYRGEHPSKEEGPFAPSYTTTFSLSANDPANALIEWVNGQPWIAANPVFLHVKDGVHTPNNYVFDISGWDGQADISLLNFWLKFDEDDGYTGAISHITVFGAPEDSDSDDGVIPEPATLLIWSALGILGLAWRFRR